MACVEEGGRTVNSWATLKLVSSWIFFFCVRQEVLIQHPHPEYVDVFLHGAQW